MKSVEKIKGIRDLESAYGEVILALDGEKDFPDGITKRQAIDIIQYHTGDRAHKILVNYGLVDPEALILENFETRERVGTGAPELERLRA